MLCFVWHVEDVFLRALSALFELEGVLSVGRIEELEWDTTDILDPKMEEVFYVLRLYALRWVFFPFFISLDLGNSCQGDSFDPTERGYVFYHKQRNLQRLAQ